MNNRLWYTLNTLSAIAIFTCMWAQDYEHRWLATMIWCLSASHDCKADAIREGKWGK